MKCGLLGILLLLCGCAAPVNSAQESTAGVPLQDREWRLIEIGGATSIRADGERQPHLRFNTEGSELTGFTGCNTLRGEYVLEGERLRIPGPVATTRMACLRRELNEQEQRLTAILGSVARYTIAGRTLTLYSADGVLARFEAPAS